MKMPLSINLREVDQKTMVSQGITSHSLMERASLRLTERFMGLVTGKDHPILILAGSGGNGGDALAMARMLFHEGYCVRTYLLLEGRQSPDNKKNQVLLEALTDVVRISGKEDFPVIHKDDVILDGLFGSGLNRPLEGLSAALVLHVNHSEAGRVISIDMPSGLSGECALPKDCCVIHASDTLSVGTLKLSQILKENTLAVGRLHLVDIGLDKDAVMESPTPYHLTLEQEVKISADLSRGTFDHKGTYGRGLVLAGKTGMAGACLLSMSAALRSGIGLLTGHVPAANRIITQSQVWEATLSVDTCEEHISILPSLDGYDAIAMGPGIGKAEDTATVLEELLQTASCPLVLDADALNIISENRHLLDMIPKGTILTPHPIEMDRLLGCGSKDSLERLTKAREMAKTRHIIIVLKGAYTSVIDWNGDCHFNTTGSAAMATAGSGDVLTGIILALLARGLSPFKAAQTGVWLHGKSGEEMVKETGENFLTARDLIEGLKKSLIILESQSSGLTL